MVTGRNWDDSYAHIADQYGVFPDGDMLQLGRVGSYPNLTKAALQIYGQTEPTYEPVNCTPSQLKGVKVQAGAQGGGYDPQNCPRMSYLDLEEQRALMTLWSIARSPLMMGGDLTMSPPEIIALLKNVDVLDMNAASDGASQLFHDRVSGSVAWKSVATGAGRLGNGTYVALFNLASRPQNVSVTFTQIFGKVAHHSCGVLELWSGKSHGNITGKVVARSLPRHGAAVFFLNDCDGSAEHAMYV